MNTPQVQILNNRLNVRTLTESGFLYQALRLREVRELKLQLRRERNARIQAFFFSGDLKENFTKFIGKRLAKMTYTLWKKGFFNAFEEFSSPHSA